MSDDAWQPIETAPDMTMVDVWVLNGDGVGGFRLAECYQRDGKWMQGHEKPNGESLGTYLVEASVTHWQPLPKPPKEG
jgi:hypothetical protein